MRRLLAAALVLATCTPAYADDLTVAGDILLQATRPTVRIQLQDSGIDRSEAPLFQIIGSKGRPGQKGGEVNPFGGQGGDATCATCSPGEGGRGIFYGGFAGQPFCPTCPGAKGGHLELQAGGGSGGLGGGPIEIGTGGGNTRPEYLKFGSAANATPIYIQPGQLHIDAGSLVEMHSPQILMYAGTGDRLVLATDNTGAQLHFGAADAKVLFDGGAEFGQGVRWHRREVVDADTTITIADRIVAYRSLSAARVVTLPSSPSADYDSGREWLIKDETGNASGSTPILVCAPAGLTLDGMPCQAIDHAYGARRVYATSVGYYTAN